MTEDSNGNLFVGIYTTGSYTANASVYKSLNGGATWSSVYYDSNGRHIHCVSVDLANNYVYASVGDVRVWSGIPGVSWTTDYVLRSTVDGNNGTWTKILQGTATTGNPQILAINVVDTTAANGTLIPLARLFGTDYDNGQIYRTTDDSVFTRVLDTGAQSYVFWIRRNDLNGNIYASVAGGDNPTVWVAGIWVSTNNGVSWTQYKSLPIHHPYLGSVVASNFLQGTIYWAVQLDSGWQNGTRFYPDYSGSSNIIQAGPMAFAIAVSQFDLSMLRGVLLSPSSIAVLTAVALAILIFPKSIKKVYSKQKFALKLIN